MAVTTAASTTTDWVTTAVTLAEDFATRAAEHDANDTFVAENYAKLREAKLFSAPVPAELGGGGAAYAQHCAIQLVKPCRRPRRNGQRCRSIWSRNYIRS